MLSQVTILILSYRRPLFLLRNMRHWMGRAARVLVLDGTREPIDPTLIGALGANVKYVHLPKSIEERFEYAHAELDTTYMMLLGDDDM